MTDNAALQESFKQAAAALSRLHEALESAEPQEELSRQFRRDAIILRFKFSYERLWKWLRRVHLARGIAPDRVRRAYEVFAEAGAAGWLKDRIVWEQMIRDRNITSHEYEEGSADAVYQRIITQHYVHMRDALEYIEAHYMKDNPFESWMERR